MMGICLSIFLPLFAVIVAMAALSIFYGPKSKPAERYLKFRKGTTIICPNPECKMEIGTASQDVYSNQMGISALWDGIHFGSRYICKQCKASYVRAGAKGNELHTKDGWISRSPEVMNASS